MDHCSQESHQLHRNNEGQDVKEGTRLGSSNYAKSHHVRAIRAEP